MKLKTVSLYAVGALVALTAATYALPRHVSTERVAVVQAAPEDVLALAASNSGFQTFNPYRTMDPDLDIALFGPDTGVGSGFSFDGKDGTGSQTVTDITDKSVVYAIDLGPMGQPTQSITAVATDTGTRVTWRVDADMGFNPAFRVFGLFMDSAMGPTFELGLDKLAEAAA